MQLAGGNKHLLSITGQMRKILPDVLLPIAPVMELCGDQLHGARIQTSYSDSVAIRI